LAKTLIKKYLYFGYLSIKFPRSLPRGNGFLKTKDNHTVAQKEKEQKTMLGIVVLREIRFPAFPGLRPLRKQSPIL
jgi:hypothetical protein